jgi:hypothetical protein
VAATGQADLTDAVRALLQPLLPVGRKPGRPLTRITILRSRGAGSTKVHLILCRGWPLALLVAVGQRGDRPRFTAVIEAIEVPRHARWTSQGSPAHVQAHLDAANGRMASTRAIATHSVSQW